MTGLRVKLPATIGRHSMPAPVSAATTSARRPASAPSSDEREAEPAALAGLAAAAARHRGPPASAEVARRSRVGPRRAPGTLAICSMPSAPDISSGRTLYPGRTNRNRSSNASPDLGARRSRRAARASSRARAATRASGAASSSSVQDDATLHRGDVVGEERAQRAHRAERAGVPALERGAQRLAVVLEQEQSVLVGERLQPPRSRSGCRAGSPRRSPWCAGRSPPRPASRSRLSVSTSMSTNRRRSPYWCSG